MQVNLTVNKKGRFLSSCSVTVIHRVTAIYRTVIYRFDCMLILLKTFPTHDYSAKTITYWKPKWLD